MPTNTPQPGDTIQGGPWDGFEVISGHTDAQALADGVLVDVGGLVPGRNNRATSAVWSEFTTAMLSGVARLHRHAPITDVTRFVAVWQRTLSAPLEDGWRILRDDTLGSLWLVPIMSWEA